MQRRLGIAAFAFCMAALCGAARADIDIKVNGEGVTRPLEQNIRAFLSLSRYEQRDDLDEDTVNRLAARVPAEARRALQPLGYYEPEITYRVTRDKDDWRVDVDVLPGRAVRVSEVNIEIGGPGKDSPAIAAFLQRRDLRPGQRLNHGTYDFVKGQLLRAAINNGYLDAHWTRSDLVIDSVERRAYITLLMETGERYHFGAITVDQNVIRDDKMRQLLRMREGEPFSLDSVLQSQYVLDDTQYFSSASVESGDRDMESLSVPVNVIAKPNKRNAYTASLGYGTDTQARGKLTWTNRYMNQNGHKAGIELTGSGIGYEGKVRYTIPVLDIALEKLEFSYTNKKEELADAVSYKHELAAELTQVLGSWQRVLFTRLSRETSEYPDSTQNTRTFLIIPGISFATLPTYILGQQQRRYAVYSELSGSPSSLGSGASFLRLRVEGERIFDLSDVWHLRVRGQIGSIWTDDFSKVPASQRFFAGGDNSVRGFGLNELSPVDALGNKIGGRNLLVSTVEVERDLPRNLRAAVFSDAGNAFDHFNDPLEYSVGVGLRWHISIASFGVDLAQPLSEPGKGVRFHLHISTLF